GADEYRSECCGVVMLRGDARRLFACRNIQDAKHAEDPVAFPRTGRSAYYMDPKDILAFSRLESEGFRVGIIYHSHPDAGPYFSETDREQALTGGEPNYPSATYVVMSVVGGTPKAAAAYTWNRDRRTFDRIDKGEFLANTRVSSPRSTQLMAAASRVIPGGVNSPVRAFRGVGGEPFFVASAEGARLTDVDGRTYLDFVGSWGPLILGHAARPIVEAVTA